MTQHGAHITLRWGLGLSTLFSAPLAWPQSVHEAETEPAPAATVATPAGQRNIGVLLAIGSYTGFGAGVQAGSPALGVQATAGWVPLLVVLEAPEHAPELEFYSGYQVGGDAYVRALQGKRDTAIGVSLGYRYHSLMGSGMALGGYGTFRVNEWLDGFGQCGLVWFVAGEDELRAKKSLPEDVEFGWPGPSINYVISVGLLLFP